MTPEVSILIMDEDKDVIEKIVGILQTQGYQVTTVCNWSQALHCAKACSVDIAIIDIQTGDSVYKEALASLQSAHPNAMLIITAASANNHTIGELEKLDSCNIMMKPYDPNELVCAIEFLSMELKRPAQKDLAFSQ